MADFQIPDKTQETNIDRAADSLLVYDNSATALRRATVNNLLDLTSHPVGTTDTQTLTNKTITAPTVSDPVLSGTVTGTYTLGGTPTFPSAVVTLTGSQTLTNKVLTSPTINTATIANPTLTTDTISEYTGAAGVTIDGVLLKDSKVNGSYITNATVTPTQWTNPYCFRARASVATTLTDATLVRVTFGTEIYDYNNNFSSPTYTAPVAGVYTFTSVVGISNAATMVDCYLSLYVNGAVSTRGGRYTMSADSAPMITCDVLLAANDTVEIYAYQNSAGNETSVANADETWFCGHLVHKV